MTIGRPRPAAARRVAIFTAMTTNPPIANRRIVLKSFGGPEALTLITDTRPTPGPGEVRLRVEYTSIAFADVMARKGKYPATPKLPFSPGYDVVGIVDALGAGVEQFSVGQRLVGLCPHFGAATESLCLNASLLVPVPDGVDAREAVCLPLNYLTAHAMLFAVGGATAGQTMFVQSAAGGVGSALVQLGLRAGLKVYGAASASKHDVVRGLGATPIDRHDASLLEALLKLEPTGVDLAFDSAGGDTVGQSLQLVRSGGRVVSFGLMGDVDRGSLARALAAFRIFVWLPLVSRSRRFGFFGHLPDRAEKNPVWFRETLSGLLEDLRTNKLKPLISRTFPLEELGAAQAWLESGKAIGKVLVAVSPTVPK